MVSVSSVCFNVSSQYWRKISAIIPEIEDPIVINKTHSMLYVSLNTVALRGWLQVVAETCRSIVTKVLVQLVGSLLVYI
jgi:hypothetical protein